MWTEYLLYSSLAMLAIACALWLMDAIDEASRETDRWLESMYDDQERER